MGHNTHSRPLDLRSVAVTDGFWRERQETVRREVIPYQWEALNDRVEGAAPSWCMHNFRAAARLMEAQRREGAAFQAPSYSYRGFQRAPEDPARPDPDRFYGYVFQDSDFAKWIEAAAYSLSQHPDPELERTADEAIDLVCAAQHESGYLDTYYIINGMDRAFTNLRDHHELYCMGHLIEAAVAYWQATGKDKLLRAACRFADCAAAQFGPGPDQRRGYPGHEIAEMALARLYEATGEEKYLDLCRFFLDQRGTKPYYFDEEARLRDELDGRPHKPNADPNRYAYHQAHLPVREQGEAVGHAVRAGYLYSGMADAARLTGDEGLRAACERLWESVAREKLYITGGVGGTVHGEAFSYPFDLPNDTAYSETCAAIALVFFARRMLQLDPKAEYADVMELALYNTVLAGMALDGRSFFYVNPLEAVPAACRADKRLEHVDPVRQKWFGCACCPPNIARLVGSVAAYAYTESGDTLWTHLYMGSELTKRVGDAVLHLTMESAFPWEGRAKMTVRADAPVECTLAFRLPGWCAEPSVSYPEGVRRTDREGYCCLTGTWREGDVVALDFPMTVRLRMADRRVREAAGKAAFTRGPLPYSLGEADTGPDLHQLLADPRRLGEASVVPVEIGGQTMQALEVPGLREVPGDGPLYADYAPADVRPVELRLIPYFAWANRGEGEMRVWLRVR